MIKNTVRFGNQNARHYSGGKSAGLSAVYLLEWRNFRLQKML